MDSLALVNEAKYNLPHGIYKAFSLKESNHRPHAIRAEVHYIEKGGAYARRVRNEAIAFARNHNYEVSTYTEIVQRGTSYTQFQLMGINIRALGYDGLFLNEITVAEAFDMFGRFVRDLRKRYPRFSDWIAAYNAGSPRMKNGRYVNQRYVNDVTRYIQLYSY